MTRTLKAGSSGTPLWPDSVSPESTGLTEATGVARRKTVLECGGKRYSARRRFLTGMKGGAALRLSLNPEPLFLGKRYSARRRFRSRASVVTARQDPEP